MSALTANATWLRWTSRLLVAVAVVLALLVTTSGCLRQAGRTTPAPRKVSTQRAVTTVPTPRPVATNVTSVTLLDDLVRIRTSLDRRDWTIADREAATLANDWAVFKPLARGTTAAAPSRPATPGTTATGPVPAAPGTTMAPGTTTAPRTTTTAPRTTTTAPATPGTTTTAPGTTGKALAPAPGAGTPRTPTTAPTNVGAPRTTAPLTTGGTRTPASIGTRRWSTTDVSSFDRSLDRLRTAIGKRDQSTALREVKALESLVNRYRMKIGTAPRTTTTAPAPGTTTPTTTQPQAPRAPAGGTKTAPTPRTPATPGGR